MKRFLMIGLLATPALGCTNLKPVGPFTGSTAPTRSVNQPNAVVMSPKDISVMPTFEDGPPPPAPSRTVTVGDVSPTSGHAAADKLMQEIEKDRKGVDAIPNYTEVSRMPRNGR